MHYLQHLPESQTVAGDNFEKFHFFVFLGKHLLLTFLKQEPWVWLSLHRA